MVYLVKLWVDYAYLDRPKCFYLVKGGGFYLVKGDCFYLVKGFCPIFGVDIAFFAISFFVAFSSFQKSQRAVRRSPLRCQVVSPKAFTAPTFLRPLATIWNQKNTKEKYIKPF